MLNREFGLLSDYEDDDAGVHRVGISLSLPIPPGRYSLEKSLACLRIDRSLLIRNSQDRKQFAGAEFMNSITGHFVHCRVTFQSTDQEDVELVLKPVTHLQRKISIDCASSF